MGFNGEAPVPGIFCILEKEETMVMKQAQIAVDQNMHRYVKIKCLRILNWIKIISVPCENF